MSLAGRILGAFGLFAVVYGLGLAVVPAVYGSLGFGEHWSLTSGLAIQITFLATSVLLMAILGRGDFAPYGFKSLAPRRLVAPIVVSAAAMLILMSPMVVMALTGAVPPEGEVGPRHFGPSNLASTIIYVWLIASTCEEVFYRGLLLGFLAPLKHLKLGTKRAGLSLPVVLCAVAFGLGHLCLRGIVPPPMLVHIIISTTVAGLVAGYYRESTGSLLPAIAAHMTFNVVGTLLPLALLDA
jgi:membrane protease YdiL (CAAX protease family)